MSYLGDRLKGVLVCDMVENCMAPVEMIDTAGYSYCAAHGLERRTYEPCRKLRMWEIRRLERGTPLNHY
jgi:hypothetical protein